MSAPPSDSEFERLSEHVFCFTDTCNAYAVVDGDIALVIDPGSGAIADVLRRETTVETIEWALHTHHHRDQCWGTWRLVEGGTEVAVPEYERHLFDEVERFWDRKRVYDNYNDRSTFYTLTESLPVSATLDDYESFAWRDVTFEVLPAKGHTFGSSALLAELDGHRVGFTGDLIRNGGTAHQLHAMEYSYGDMKGVPFTIQSLNALEKQGLDLLLPSHGESITEPAKDIDRLRRRLMKIVDLGPRINAGSRAYLPEARMIPVSDHLLWGGPWTCSNFYVLRSESGKALFVDYGHSLTDHMHHMMDREDMETMRFVEHHLDELHDDHGIDAIDVVIPTHIHDDHTCGIPHLQRHYNADCWALDEVAHVLEAPAAWSSTPCVFPESIAVDRRFDDGETFQWEEYEFDIHHAPGQTEFHSTLVADIDGRRVAFTGDNYFERQVDIHYDRQEERPFQTTVLRNSFQFDMHRRCAKLLLAIEPDLICPGHGEVLDIDPSKIATYCDFVERKERAFRAATANPAEQGVDLFWARLVPYQTSATPGDVVDYALHLRNNFDRAIEYHVELLAPDGRTVIGDGELRLAPGERGRLAVPAEVGSWGGGRQVVTAEIRLDGDSRGPVVEALIETPP